MTIGVPLISKNCLEGAPFLPAGAMRVPRPAAGMMTVTFIGVKSITTLQRVAYAGLQADGQGHSASSCRSGFRLRRSGFRFSREHFSQGPFNPPGPFLDDADLFGLFLQERGVNYRLQGIADMVVHFGNYPHPGQHKLMLVPLIGEYHRTGSDA